MNKHLILLAFLLATMGIRAQENELLFERIGTSQGLSFSIVPAMLEDSRGFIWMGTGNGLNRYDGYSFHTFESIPDDSTTISHFSIAALEEDSIRNIWIGTTRGVNIYKYETGTFIRHICDPENPNTIIDNEATFLFKDSKNNIWVFSEYGINEAILNKNGTFKFKRHYFDSLIAFSTFNSRRIYSVIDFSDDILWISTGEGIVKFCKKNNKTQLLWSHLEFQKIFRHKDKIFGLYSNSWYEFDFEDFEFEKKVTFEAETTIDNAFFKEDSLVWLVSSNGEFFSFNPINYNYNKLKTKIINAPKEAYYNVKGFLKSQNEIIWMYSENGIFKFSEKKNRFKQLQIESRKKYAVYGLKALDKGFVFATAEGKFYYFDGITIIEILGEHFHDFEYRLVSDIEQDRYNNYFVSISGYGLIIFDQLPYPTKATHITPKNSLIGYGARGICFDDEGSLWYSSVDYGLCKLSFTYDEENFIADHEVFEINDLKTPGGKNVHSWNVIQHIDGKIYLCTDRNGVYVLNKKGEVLSNLLNESNRYLTPSTKSFHIDFENNLWITTGGQGIKKLNTNDHRITSFSTREGLSNSSTYNIIEDNNQNLWITTDYGLSKLDLKNNSFQNFYIEDGLLDNEFSFGPVDMTKDGYIIMGTQSGLIYFDPNKIFQTNFNPPLYITNLQLFNKEITPTNNPNILSEDITITNEIKLHHQSRSFTFEFAALDYAAPEKIRYRYKLDGFEEQWTTIEAAGRHAYYTNIPPGEYEFVVESTNSDGIWVENTISISIHIPPPWWKTLIFRILLVISISMLVILGYYFRLAAIRRQRNVLKRQVIQRTHEIESQKEELSVQAENLKALNSQLTERQNELSDINRDLKGLNATKDKFFRIIAHDLKNPFQAIMGFSDILLKKGHHLNEEKRKEFLDNVNSSAKSIFHLLENLLNWARSQSGEIKLKKVNFDVNELVNTAIELLKYSAEKKNIIILNEIPETLLINADMNMIHTVFRNLINNAIKYTKPGGMIHLTGEQQDEKVKINIKDNGVGMSRVKVENLFLIEKSDSTKGTSGESGTGLGLIVCHDFIAQNNGKIEINSELGKGSTFTVILPSANSFETVDVDILKKDNERDDLFVNEKQESIIAEEGIEVNLDLLKQKVILVVEDTPQILSNIVNIFPEETHIFEAENGSDGLIIALHNIPDLIITDVMMPGLDGHELCKRLKTDEKTSHIPVIMLTAKSSDKDKLEGLETGADDYITKPFNHDILLARATNLLKNRRLLKEKFSSSFFTDTQLVAINSTEEKFLSKLKSVIEEKMENSEFNVEQLSLELSMSRANLFRKLKAYTNQSPIELIRKMRLEKAASLLKSGEYNVSEVAQITGFNDSAYLSRTFTKEYGVNPSQFKDS